MKVLSINNSLPLSISKQQEIARLKKKSAMSNPLQKHTLFATGVSFRALNNIKTENPYDKGYEDIKLNENGFISNSSRYLVINSVEDFLAVSRSQNSLNKYFILNNDIDLKDVEVFPLGSSRKPFSGVFDGNSYTIKNLTLKSEKNDLGLFASTANAKILNLKIFGAKIDGNNDVGAIVGYAENTSFENCSVEAQLSGKNAVGGLVGVCENCSFDDVKFFGQILSKNQKEGFSLFGKGQAENISENFGGIVGLDNASYINGAYVDAKIKSEGVVGGIVANIIGNSKTKIENCCFEGQIVSNKANGAIVGSGENFEITNCVVLQNNVVGRSKTGIVSNCITDRKQVANKDFSDWDKKYWHIAPEMLPRHLVTKSKEDVVKIFLEDVNTSRDIGKFPYTGITYTPEPFVEVPIKIEPPKNYERNFLLINRINKSTNPDWLFKMFDDYTDSVRTGFSQEMEAPVDEILLAIVKNKHFPVNRRYKNPFKNSYTCTPLYISSRFDKPYVFAEMLKRDDIDFDVPSGPEDNTYVLNMLLSYPDDVALYLLYSSQNPIVVKHLKENLEKYKHLSDYSSKMLKILNRTYPDVPKYDKEKQIVQIPREFFTELGDKTEGNFSYDTNNKEMCSLDDVMRNLDVNVNFRDSNGNNLINVAVEMNDELEAFVVYKKAFENGTDFNNKNVKGYTPIQQLLETGRNQEILSELIQNMIDLYETNSFGENAIHIFSKNPIENKAIKYISKLLRQGMSLNLQDDNGVTALMNSIDCKKINLFKFLIYSGADINLCDANGQSALHYACLNCETLEDLDFVYTLVKQSANLNIVDNNGHKAFDYLSDNFKAIVSMNVEEIKSFNESLPDRIARVKAVEYKAQEEFLNDNGFSETSSEKFKIEKISKGMLKDLDYSNVEDVISNIDNEKDLQLFLLKFLRDLGWYHTNGLTNPAPENILNILSTLNHPIANECIKKVCEIFPKKVNLKNEFGETPLMLSVDSYETAKNDFEKLCCINNINVLLANGADVNILDDNKQNVLHRVCQSNCLILLSKFLEKDVNINQKDVLGKNPLEYLSKEITNKMRNYFENYAREKGITLGIENILKGIKK